MCACVCVCGWEVGWEGSRNDEWIDAHSRDWLLPPMIGGYGGPSVGHTPM